VFEEAWVRAFNANADGECKSYPHSYLRSLAFIGFLYLDYTYNNPVVNMFVKLLMDTDST